MEPTAPAPVFALSMHASYGCRHSGVCCSSGWSIPVEPPLRSLYGTDELSPDDEGRCRWHDPIAHRCRAHEAFGHARLPLSCRIFPRRVLFDDRGAHVTLSCYCPTAAQVLADPAPLAIVKSPPAFPIAALEDGLDARGVWPPLVAPTLLFDLDAFAQWEAFLVDSLGRAGDTGIDVALARIASVAERARTWTPGAGSMLLFLEACFAAPESIDALARYAAYAGLAAHGLASATAPDDLRPAPVSASDHDADARWVAPTWLGLSRVVGRYLAARAFASWSAYQVRGVRALVAEIVLTAGVLRVEAGRHAARARRPLDEALLLEGVRASDRLLVHAADRERLVAVLNRAEA